ncbi:MAG TPA: polysaccharide deacetylase family protein [Caldimonas sp.]|nr:polysaccharide deacetylase family protein [Caldimonas sp.]
MSPRSPAATRPAGAADRFVCVVLHDVATSTRSACLRTLAAVAEVADVPLTLLAVPHYHGEASTRELEAWLTARSQRGDELALHGYTHRDDLPPRGWLDRLRRRHYTRGEGEFWALTEVDARQRIETGIAWFRANGWPLHGFVAPAWLLGTQAWGALDGFEYTSTLRQIVMLPGRERLTSQSVVYSTSSAWRRRTSLVWNAWVARRERANALLRIELHPRDADFAAVRRSWQSILEHALRDRQPVTVADLVAHWRPNGEPRAAGTTTWQTTTARED